MMSILRDLQYKSLSKLTLDGKIIDLGGSRKSGYHELIKGNHSFDVVNIDENYGYDLKFNLEDAFPLEDRTYDHVLCINVIEHIFNYQNVFSESFRILKNGGKFVYSVPFLFRIHGCPNDFNRFTKEALIRITKNNGFEVEEVKELGFGFFSLFFQLFFVNVIPTKVLKSILKNICISIDVLTLKLSSRYQRWASDNVMGYFIIAFKK